MCYPDGSDVANRMRTIGVSSTLDQFEGQSLDQDQDQRVDIADIQDINFELTRGYTIDYFDWI